MKAKHFNFLKKHQACEPGLEWAKTQSDLYELWNNCHRGDWLLWLANELNVDKRKLMLCGALCAHTVVQFMGDRASREAVRVAFLYARGKATDAQLEAAKIDTADAWYVVHPAAAAARAARAARAAVYAAVYAAWNDPDVDDHAARAARQANQLRTAEIARKNLTEEVFEKINQL